MADLSKHSTATGIRGTFNDSRLSAVIKDLSEYAEYETQVGYYTRTTYDDGTLVSAVAAFHEFGTETMPQRSFIRSTLHEHRKEIGDATAQGVNGIISGKMTPAKAAAHIARTIGGLVYKRLVTADQWAKGLRPRTIAAKGHDFPLYDTGKLRDDLMWRVRHRGRIVAQGHAKNVRL